MGWSAAPVSSCDRGGNVGRGEGMCSGLSYTSLWPGGPTAPGARLPARGLSQGPGPGRKEQRSAWGTEWMERRKAG